MPVLDTIVMLVFWGMALWGLLSLPLIVMSYFWLKGLLLVPLRCKLKNGAKMILHMRGLGIYPQYVPPGHTEFELKDARGKMRKFDIDDRTFRLIAGVPVALSIDDFPRTFSADQILDISRQMTNAHIHNLNSFSTPLRDETGNIVMRKVPLFDEVTGQQLTDSQGQPIFREVVAFQYHPIDPNMPDYEIPEFLSSKNLADRIEVESILATRQAGGKDNRSMIYLGACLMLAGLGVAAIIVLVLYAPQKAPQVAGAVIQTTTTLFQSGPTTTLSPPPMV